MIKKQKTVSFTSMKEGSKADYELLQKLEKPYLAMTSNRIIEALEIQGETTLPGYKITRLEHGLQAASRAENQGADIDWIIGALLHDIGDGLAPQNHDRLSAEIIRPYVRWEVTWTVEHHGIFQMFYYAHHYNWDKNARSKYKNHPCFDNCKFFCEYWDQVSFDPSYKSKKLSHFEPMLKQVFSRKAYDPKILLNGFVTSLETTIKK